MTEPRACRLAVLASHPIQYFTPLYKRLAQVPGLELEVLFCRDYGVKPRFDKQFGKAIAWDTDQLSGYRHRFLRNISPIKDTFTPLHAINPGAFTALLGGYDALWVNGYLYPSNWLAALAGALRGTRLLMRSELRVYEWRERRPHHAIRDALVRAWVRRSDALLYIGKANREAYLHYGATEDKLFFSPYSADTLAIDAASRMSAEEKAALRRELGIPEGRRVVLSVGKLIGLKHPEALLHLSERAGAARDRFQVVFAGSGPMEEDVRADAARRGLDNVTFLGFVNQSVLPRVYGIADVYVFPSDGETWGLTLNEAMAAGVPPVVSDAVGASPDMITPGVTGFPFPSGDWEAMSDAVMRLLDDDALRARVGEAARERSHAYSHERSVAGILEALQALGVYAPAAGALAAAAAAG